MCWQGSRAAYLSIFVPAAKHDLRVFFMKQIFLKLTASHLILAFSFLITTLTAVIMMMMTSVTVWPWTWHPCSGCLCNVKLNWTGSANCPKVTGIVIRRQGGSRTREVMRLYRALGIGDKIWTWFAFLIPFSVCRIECLHTYEYC